MTQPIPTQELVAKDLHGIEWRFKHIFRGQYALVFFCRCLKIAKRVSGNFLKVLQMPMTDITDKLISKHIKPLPNLTILDVSHCINITSEGLKTFGYQCKLLHLKRNMPAFEDQLSVA
ncbi:putative DNA-binding pseudobarrel domain superfamily, leucine-rich repeat domain superfamily [Helianthus annuus]|uniref:DNA-binding pseudobarrel domain superfamily, leucine-rich repeat domain superfamily n=1 Tax=Helianthus annuus TaxID=4232 RepID=A0A9K3HJ19_HELAN|nr:putative DNA-binding pseudobarrel domain superfamily, leucine-rich repeat domain superfamily [Helianthus annuus]KAJ0863994.1 putative DNA-binding pseudobarrel domain superfamily, leucine-rich repeat domain superfamily [Helianthus annuus]